MSLKEDIEKAASLYAIKPEFIASIVYKESRGNADAIRFEPLFYENKLKGKSRSDLSGFVPDIKMVSADTELFARATSWGLMQVMGESARCYGKYDKPYLSSLLNPEDGLAVGCRIYAHYYKITLSHHRALRMYNAGSIASNRGIAYADSVMKILESKEYKEIYG